MRTRETHPPLDVGALREFVDSGTGTYPDRVLYVEINGREYEVCKITRQPEVHGGGIVFGIRDAELPR